MPDWSTSAPNKQYRQRTCLYRVLKHPYRLQCFASIRRHARYAVKAVIVVHDELEETLFVLMNSLSCSASGTLDLPAR